MKQESLYRVVDANLNRLREGVRVVEEVFRFIYEDEQRSVALKKIRHRLQDIENELDTYELLAARDSGSDIFSEGAVAAESRRDTLESLVKANIRRAQEASRVLEEFLKMSEVPQTALIAKEVRFSLYTIEKEWGVDAKKEEK